MGSWRGRSDEDFADEISAHLAFETERLIQQGISPDEASARARRAFGNVTVHRERFHNRGPRLLIEEVQQDLRYAGRSLRRSPVFAVIAILCLAVGISVNTAAFSVLNAMLFRDFPGVVKQRDLATILIGEETKWGRSGPSYAAVPDWEEFRSGLPSFSAIAAFGSSPVSARTTRDPEVVRADFVSPEFFNVLGTVPALGRLHSPSDSSANDVHTAVLSHAYWERAFQARADVAGTIITIGTQAFTIVGVAPKGFVGLYPGEILDADVGAPELFLPLAAAPYVRASSADANITAALDDRWLRLVGRRREGVSIESVRAEATAIAARLARRYPVERKAAYVSVLAGGGATASSTETAAGVLGVMAVPVIILLVACANLANQMLTRAVQRSREIAVRLSLGATRARVVRQLLVEAAAISAVASVVGMFFARWILDALRAFVLALPFRIPLDSSVMLFTVGVAAVTSVVFGLVPALRATRADLTVSLREGSPGGGYRRSRLQGSLIVIQIAASLALIAMSGVFVRASQPRASNAASTPGNTIVVALNPELLGLTAQAGRAYQQALLERARNLPGMTAASLATFSPFQQPDPKQLHDLSQSGGKDDYYDVAEVSGDWFGVNSERLIAGRLPTAAELSGPPTIAVVDAVLAHNWWRDSTAVGRSLRVGEGNAATIVTIVGVIDTIWDAAFRQPEGRMIMPSTGSFDARTYLYARTNSPPEAMIGALRNAVRALDSRMPVLWVRTLEDVTAREAAPLAMLADGLRALGIVALLLAALGLYGVMSFVVAQRRREIGIRVALGARSNDVTWMVLRHALRLGAVGVVIGAFVAIATAISFRSLIHGLPAVPPATLGQGAIMMLLVAMIASFVPARRAAGVDPNVALRDE